jgi:hypothetical protein
MGMLVGTTTSRCFLGIVSASVLDTAVPPQAENDRESAKGKTTGKTRLRKRKSELKEVGKGEFIGGFKKSRVGAALNS